MVSSKTTIEAGPGGIGPDGRRGRGLTVIFDFDGTIADTLAAIVRLANRHHVELGLPRLEEPDVRALRGMTPRAVMKKYRIPLHKLPQIILRYQKELHQEMDKMGLFPGIRELLVELKEFGVKLGILTSNSRENVLKFLRARELEVFDFIHSESNLFGKSRALKHLLRDEDVGGGEVMYVGDEVRDIEACRRAMIPVIAVSWGFHRRDLLEGEDPTWLVDSPDEIRQIVLA